MIDNALMYDRKSIKNLFNEITLLDMTRQQSYKNFLDLELVNILEKYERENN